MNESKIQAQIDTRCPCMSKPVNECDCMSESREVADQIYQDFCESEGGVNHPLQEAWDAYEAKYGDISIGSEIEELVYQAIVYAVQKVKEG